MPKNAKLIIIVLGALLLFSVFIALSTFSQKDFLEKSKAKLETDLAQYKDKEQKLSQENKRLADQLQEAQGLESKIQKQYSDLNSKVSTISSERDDWKTKVNDLKKERDQLLAKIDELENKPQAAAAVPATPTPSEMVAKPEIGSASEGQEKYWASLLKDKASLELKLSDLQAKLSSSSVETEELKKKASDVESELGQLKNEKEEMQRKIKYSEDLANTLSIELAREKNDKRYVADKIDQIKEENLALRAQVKELSTSKIVLEKNIAKLSADKTTIERKLAETESVIQNRIDDVMDIKSKLDKRIQGSSASTTAKEIELPPIIVNASSPSGGKLSALKDGGTPGFNGKILSINPENNFVVIDIGEDAGIHISDALSVYRGSKYIASLEVIQVRKDISAADIKQKGAKIEVGDTVR